MFKVFYEIDSISIWHEGSPMTFSASADGYQFPNYDLILWWFDREDVCCPYNGCGFVWSSN